MAGFPIDGHICKVTVHAYQQVKYLSLSLPSEIEETDDLPNVVMSTRLTAIGNMHQLQVKSQLVATTSAISHAYCAKVNLTSLMSSITTQLNALSCHSQTHCPTQFTARIVIEA